MINFANRLRSNAKAFVSNSHGGATLHSALLFGAVAMALSVLVAPQLKSAADTFAENRALGIDRVITSSIKKTENTYTVRKSVLDK